MRTLLKVTTIRGHRQEWARLKFKCPLYECVVLPRFSTAHSYHQLYTLHVDKWLVHTGKPCHYQERSLHNRTDFNKLFKYSLAYCHL